MKIFLSTLLSGFLFFAFSINVQAQAQAQAQDVASDTTVATKERTILVKVTGVGCSNDVRSIAANVEKLDGVNACTVIKKAAVTRYEVSFDPAIVSEEAIHTAVEATPGCSNQASRPYQVKI